MANKDNYIKITTTFSKPAILVKQAARISGRVQSFLLNKIDKGDLDFGYVCDTDGDKSSSGEKLIILNQKWEDFLVQCRALDAKRAKQVALSVQDFQSYAKAETQNRPSQKEIWMAVAKGLLDADNQDRIIQNDKSNKFIGKN